MPLVSVIILTYNASAYIKKCLGSVLSQTYPNLEIIIVDNNSTDENVSIAKDLLSHSALIANCWSLIANSENVGFAAGQNQGIAASKGEFVLCLNQDAWLDKDFIANAVAAIGKDPKIATIQGNLIRYDFKNDKPLNIIDTHGLKIFKNRRVININQGSSFVIARHEAISFFPIEIFGADGAAPLYRKSALEDAKLLNEYFDESFFMYKEDVDLAWRLRLLDWKTIYEPKCVAYHGRGAGDSAAQNYFEALRERRKISKNAKFYSWKNQRLMQIKNETASLFFRHIFHIFPKEIVSLLYILIFEEPQAAKAIWQFFKQVPLAYKKRKIIMAKRRANNQDMLKWFE